MESGGDCTVIHNTKSMLWVVFTMVYIFRFYRIQTSGTR